MKKKSGLIAGIVILILLCIGAGVLYQNMKPAASEGEKHITVTVIHGDQTENVFEIVIYGILSAVLLTAQVSLGFLPNIEIVTLLILVYTLVFRKKVFFIIYIFVFLEGLIYGFGLWWINYLYVWSIQALITLLFRKNDSVWFWSILSGIYGITFGALCTIPYFAIGGISGAFAYWTSGLLFDIIHCISNFIVCLVLFKPIRYVLEKCIQQIK